MTPPTVLFPDAKFLIVDDFTSMRRIIRTILKQIGYIYVEEAENGLIAQNKLSATDFDFIICDWNMPVMDGLECMRTLRADGDIAQPKIIFCTTENEMEKIQTAIMAGADEYVMKPFDEEIIAGKMRQLGIIEDEAM